MPKITIIEYQCQICHHKQKTAVLNECKQHNYRTCYQNINNKNSTCDDRKHIKQKPFIIVNEYPIYIQMHEYLIRDDFINQLDVINWWEKSQIYRKNLSETSWKNIKQTLIKYKYLYVTNYKYKRSLLQKFTGNDPINESILQSNIDIVIHYQQVCEFAGIIHKYCQLLQQMTLTCLCCQLQCH